MFDAKQLVTSALQTIPENLRQELSQFHMLERDQQLNLRDRVLLYVAFPSTQTRVIALALAYGMAKYMPAQDRAFQEEMAGALLGGWFGYHAINYINYMYGDVYTATVLEESLVAALGGLAGTMTIEEVTRAFRNVSKTVLGEDNIIQKNLSSDTATYQTYNVYVLLTTIIPILLRVAMANYFNELYPLKPEGSNKPIVNTNTPIKNATSQNVQVPLAGYNRYGTLR